MIFWH